MSPELSFIGPSYALWFSTAHEYTNKMEGEEAYDTAMDMHNNYVGSTVVHTTPDGELMIGVIKQELQDKLSAGELWILDDNLMLIGSDGSSIYE